MGSYRIFRIWVLIKKEKSTIQRGVILFFEFDVNAVFCGIPVGDGLDERNFGILPFGFEQVAEPLLGFEILLDRFPDHFFNFGDRPVNHLVVDPETRINGKFCNFHGLLAFKTPAGTAGACELDIAGPGVLIAFSTFCIRSVG